MSLSHLFKSISFITGSLVISSILFTESAEAFSVTLENGGFEDNYTSWSQTGDASIRGTFQGINPVSGSQHSLITTGHHTRIDDHATPAGTFNYSGTSPASATTNANAAELQNFLGLPINSLSINRQNSADDSAFRTAKEGSAIFQDFTVTITEDDVTSGKNQLRLKFNWSYLTNDSTNSILGDQDFAFFTLYDLNSDINTRTINVLDNSSGNISYPLGSGVTTFQDTNTTYYSAGNQYIYDDLSSLEAGTYNYRVGFGVVDVDGVDRTSALLIDDFMAEEVPFEFSPSLGIILCGSFFGAFKLRKRLQKN